jgi:hypothetical protein
VAEPVEAGTAAPAFLEIRSHGAEDFDYAEEFKKLDYAALKKDLRALMTRVAGLVAGRFRALRPAVHPHGLA